MAAAGDLVEHQQALPEAVVRGFPAKEKHQLDIILLVLEEQITVHPAVEQMPIPLLTAHQFRVAEARQVVAPVQEHQTLLRGLRLHSALAREAAVDTKAPSQHITMGALAAHRAM